MEEQPKAPGAQDASLKLKLFGAFSAGCGLIELSGSTYLFLSGEILVGNSIYWPSAILLLFVNVLSIAGILFICRGLLSGSMSWDRPSGALIDVLLPPEEAEHRCVALEEGFERWEARYGLRRARWIYVWQVVQAIGFFYYSKIRKG